MDRIDPANAEAAQAWNGPDGTFWADHHQLFDEAVAPHHARLLDEAAITPAEQVLDIGCGNGQTTCDAARRARSGRVVGIDLSSSMLAVAERRCAQAGLTNVSFVNGDAQVYPFDPAGFDRAISRTGTMFFADPVAAFANIGAALRPGGRLVQLVWQSLVDNEWIDTFRRILAAGRDLPAPPSGAPGPFALADPDRVGGLLTQAGFADVEFKDVREPMYFGRDIDEAHRFVMSLMAGLLADLDGRARQRALDELHSDIAAHYDGTGVRYKSSAWLITAVR